jgi:C_GCAxxG_C_C family probable redox protein
MKQTLSRRQMVCGAGTALVALALPACRKSATPAATKENRENEENQAPIASPPPPPPSETLTRSELLEFLDERAAINMERCHHCAQASFLTLREGFGLPDGDIFKALTPLPGIAERGETCGAVIGSLMAIGLLFGRERLGDGSTWRASLVPARNFCEKFEQELGSTQCGDLLEQHFGKRYDLADPLERAEFLAARPGPSEICGRVVRTAVRLATEAILEEERE